MKKPTLTLFALLALTLAVCENVAVNAQPQHQMQDKLVCLGRAIGAVEFVMPRDLWKVFPGGMPYIVINDNYNIAAK